MLSVIKSIRAPFLILTPACILVGLASALHSGHTLVYGDVALVLVGALLAHIGVNTLNEYEDFRSGLDLCTQKTPFSGGSGGLVQEPAGLNRVAGMAMVSLAGLVAIGIYFALKMGLGILVLGLVGLLIIVTYTRWINRSPILCLIAPGLGFGPLMVMGTELSLTGQITSTGLVVSMMPFFLTNNLLLLNQFPDIEADKKVGRYHFPIAYGRKKSVILYLVFALLAAAVLIAGVILAWLPSFCLLALVPLALSLKVFMGAGKNANDTTKLLPYMGINVGVAVATPAILGITLMLG